MPRKRKAQQAIAPPAPIGDPFAGLSEVLDRFSPTGRDWTMPLYSVGCGATGMLALSLLAPDVPLQVYAIAGIAPALLPHTMKAALVAADKFTEWRESWSEQRHEQALERAELEQEAQATTLAHEERMQELRIEQWKLSNQRAEIHARLVERTAAAERVGRLFVDNPDVAKRVVAQRRLWQDEILPAIYKDGPKPWNRGQPFSKKRIGRQFDQLVEAGAISLNGTQPQWNYEQLPDAEAAMNLLERQAIFEVEP